MRDRLGGWVSRTREGRGSGRAGSERCPLEERGARLFSLYPVSYLAPRSPRPPRRRRASPCGRPPGRTRPGNWKEKRERRRGRESFFRPSARSRGASSPRSARARAAHSHYLQMPVWREDGDRPVVLGHGCGAFLGVSGGFDGKNEREGVFFFRLSLFHFSFSFTFRPPLLPPSLHHHVGVLAVPHVQGQDPAPPPAGGRVGGRRDRVIGGKRGEGSFLFLWWSCIGATSRPAGVVRDRPAPPQGSA